MAYADQYDLAQDTIFRKRIHIAMATAAINVAGEPQAEMSDAAYSKRQALATQALRTPGAFVEVFALAVAQNPAITGASLDSDIQFTVNSVWNDMAGVTGLD